MDSCCTYIPLQGILTSDWLFCQTEMLPDSKVQTWPVGKSGVMSLKNCARISIKFKFDVLYASQTGNPCQRLDIYLPKQFGSDNKLPVIVFLHGGGWFQETRPTVRPMMPSSFAVPNRRLRKDCDVRISVEAAGSSDNAAIIRDNQNIRCDYPFKRTGGLDDCCQTLALLGAPAKIPTTKNRWKCRLKEPQVQVTYSVTCSPL